MSTRILNAALFGTMALSSVAGTADAAKLCGDRDLILERLEQKYEETPRALGLSDDGGVLELLVSPDGDFTLLHTLPGRLTCLVAVGTHWSELQLIGDPT